MNWLRSFAIFVFGVCAIFGSNRTNADEVLAVEGWNLYQTENAFISLGPVLGEFESVPIGNFDFGGSIGVRNTGQTDTIVQRYESASDGGVEVDTVLIALSLRSVNPIDIGAGMEFVSTNVISGDGFLFFLGNGYFDSGFTDVVLQFTGDSSGTMVTESLHLYGGLDWPWGNSPLENNALKITGVNYLVNGTGTGQDFWPHKPNRYFDPGGNTALLWHNTTIPEPTSFLMLSACWVEGWIRRKR